MNPMQSFKVAVAAIALLLTACAPAALASTPATIASAPTDAEVAMVDATATSVSTTAPVAQTATAVPLSATSNSEPAVAALAQSPAPAYENLNSPVDLLASYYNAINRKEYQRAYGYWQTPPMSYQKFASGFSDTTSAQLIVQPPTSGEGAAGSTYVQISTVLVAKHTDNSTHTYAGCIVTRKSNLQPPDIPKADVWHIYSAQLKEVPNNTSIPNQLAQACPS